MLKKAGFQYLNNKVSYSPLVHPFDQFLWHSALLIPILLMVMILLLFLELFSLSNHHQKTGP